jgi:SAM-dependent methyltransferase
MSQPRPENPAQWDERFSTPEYVYGEHPNDFIRHIGRTALTTPLDVLCLCEGEGRNAVWLAEQGHRVTNADLSPVGLAKCRALAERRGVSVQTLEADMSNYAAAPNSADLVVLVFAHTPATVRPRMLAQVGHALRPGGKVLLECYTPDQVGRGTGGPPVPEMMYTLDELRAVFHGWREHHAEEMVRDVIEGRLHTGEAAVVQFFAEKP